jgi:hypothetical protein
MSGVTRAAQLNSTTASLTSSKGLGDGWAGWWAISTCRLTNPPAVKHHLINVVDSDHRDHGPPSCGLSSFPGVVVTAPLQFTFTGPVTINQVDFDPVFTRLTALEATMTAAFGSVSEALDALQAESQALAAAEAADRAAFDALAATVRAFIAALPAPGETLTAEHAAQAQAILDTLTATEASEDAEAVDEAALQGEVPA